MICYTVLQLYIVAINSSSGAWRGKAESSASGRPIHGLCLARGMDGTRPVLFSNPALLGPPSSSSRPSALFCSSLQRSPAESASAPPPDSGSILPLLPLRTPLLFLRSFLHLHLHRFRVPRASLFHHPRAKDPSPSMVASFVCSSLPRVLLSLRSSL